MQNTNMARDIDRTKAFGCFYTGEVKAASTFLPGSFNLRFNYY